MAIVNFVISHGFAVLTAALALYVLPSIALKEWNRWSKAGRLPMPPGPPAEFLLGHIRVIPVDFPEYAFARWHKEYKSDILSFRVLNQNIIVLNTAEAAQELMNRRSANYNYRPRLCLFNEVMGFAHVETMALITMGNVWRLSRRMMQMYLFKSQTLIPHYHKGHQQRELTLLLRRYVDNPRTSVKKAFTKFGTAMMLGSTYGLRIWEDDDPFMKAADGVREVLGNSGAIGATPTDFFPFLRFLPRWMEDASLKVARDGRQHVIDAWYAPYGAVKQSAEKVPCLLRDILDDREKQIQSGIQPDMTEHQINGMVGTVNIAGQDTLWSSLLVWVFNMVLHPDIQAKARKAVDEVVGRDRLPTLEDRPNIPYLDCMLQEILRWSPALPLGIAHASGEDDVYNGYFIPGGSVVIANTHAMTHDEDIYQNPDAFEPERFLPVESGGRGEPHPSGQFGFGRRICPGRHVGEATVWSVMACMLSTMTIEKDIDSEGKPVTPVAKFSNGLVQHLNDFPCVIKPRDQRSIDLIHSMPLGE